MVPKTGVFSLDKSIEPPNNAFERVAVCHLDSGNPTNNGEGNLSVPLGNTNTAGS